MAITKKYNYTKINSMKNSKKIGRTKNYIISSRMTKKNRKNYRKTRKIGGSMGKRAQKGYEAGLRGNHLRRLTGL